MAQIARDLAAIEVDASDSHVVPPRTLAAINAARAAHGIPPLAEEEDPPELELYRRARALGLPRIRR